jgi:hypothetical protein
MLVYTQIPSVLQSCNLIYIMVYTSSLFIQIIIPGLYIQKLLCMVSTYRRMDHCDLHMFIHLYTVKCLSCEGIENSQFRQACVTFHARLGMWHIAKSISLAYSVWRQHFTFHIHSRELYNREFISPKGRPL